MKWFDGMARGYRNARAAGALAVIVVAILSMLSLRCNPVVGRDEVLGLVLEVQAEGLRPTGEGEYLSRSLVATPDSVEILLLLPPPAPRPGDFVPLVAERHRKGDTEYRPDLEKWRLHGPQ